MSRRREVRRIVFLLLGFLSVALGVAGLLLPVLPGTPFLLLAAYFFSESSERFHNWLLEHRFLGPPVRRWQQHGAIPLSAKLTATVFMLITSAFVLPRDILPLWGKCIYGGTVVFALAFIWSRPRL